MFRATTQEWPGAAYVFVRQNTEWDYRRISLDAAAAVPGGRFGASAAVGEDTIVVGAPGTERRERPGLGVRVH